MIFVYMMTTVLLVRRQLNQEEEMEKVAMANIRGETEVKLLDKVVSDKKKVLI